MNKQQIALRVAIKALEFAWENEAPRFEEKALDALWKALVGYDFWTPDDMAYRPGGLPMSAELQPLTDEEICSLAEQHLEAFTQYVDAGEAYYEGEIEFARAIEKKIRGE